MRNEKKRGHVQEFDVATNHKLGLKDLSKSGSSRLIKIIGNPPTYQIDPAVVGVS
jgi:hypothetical protein